MSKIKKQEKPILDVVGQVIIEEWPEKVITYISGQGWLLEMRGWPAALRSGDKARVKVYKEAAKGGE